MIYLLSAALALLAVEILLALGRSGVLQRMVRAARLSATTIQRPRASDHWKQRVILRCSAILLTSSLRLLLWLALLAGAAYGLHRLGTRWSLDVFAYLLTLEGILVLTGMALVYGWIRPRPAPAGSDYGPGSRLLHRLALANPILAEISFDLDQTLASPDGESIRQERHVFVAGLARAGTTVLMRRLYSTAAFTSLTYRDMPFVLMPSLWRKITALSRKDSVKTERAHGDGLLVDFDSPEALEEVFWRTFCHSEYIRPDHLVPMTAPEEVLTKFRAYVASILGPCASGRPRRYLSKNNNNILRLASIHSAFPKATLIVPFRDPVQQAWSLRNQHTRFIEQQKKDPFIRSYMTWLAHHEFGADHRRFLQCHDLAAADDPTTLSYWVELWITVYSHLAAKAPQETVFLDYESLCRETDRIWPALEARLALPELGPDADALLLRHRSLDDPIPTPLRETAQALHATLAERMEQALFSSASP